MNLRKATFLTLTAVSTFTFALPAIAAPIVWTGPRIEFTKEGFADWTLPENQDRITDNVWITRGDIRGIFNAAVEGFPETNADSFGPAGTEWAEGTTADLESLEFTTWRDATEHSPFTSAGKDYVVHLIEDDIYLDLQILFWGDNTTGGAFSYSRTTPVPEPTAALLALVALPLVWKLRRR